MQTMDIDSKKTECPAAQTLEQYLTGSLGEPELGSCEAHLAECPRCEDTVRGLGNATGNDSISQLALEAFQHQKHRSSTDAPLVDQLIRDLSGRTPDPHHSAKALENRAAEVTRLLPPSDLTDAIGKIGDYQVLKLLGAGSTGIVYQAQDTKLQRQVALKVLRPSLGDAARERFMNEARAAAAISHPNVITIYQVGFIGELAYIAMELSDGQTLESRLAEVSFVPQDKITRIALQVAEGLAAAHRHGLIHRDIKPANIWLKAETDDAVILDFGLARIADDDPQMTATGMLAGTPNFMSPEQTRGLELDGRSDLFSLGCLMYRASTGKLPFGSTGILATLQSIQHDTPRVPELLNPHLSADFSDLVMALLEKQPANRPESADQVINALQSERSRWPFLVSSYDQQNDQATTQPSLSFQPPESAGFRARRWIASALLLTALGGLGWFFAPQIIRIATDQGELVIDAKDKAVEVEVLQGGEIVQIIDTKTGQRIDIKAGEYDLRLTHPESGFRLNRDRVVLTRGDREVVSVQRTMGERIENGGEVLYWKSQTASSQHGIDTEETNMGIGEQIAGDEQTVGNVPYNPQQNSGNRFRVPELVRAGSKTPLYAGKTFDQWMDVVKNDRQMKTKFEALAAVAELAQGDEELKKQVLQQIKPLLRKHGSNVTSGTQPFGTNFANAPVKNRFSNLELTQPFIEILQRFPANDLMDFAIEEIKNGTVNSRNFLFWLWQPGNMRTNDVEGQREYLLAINQHAPEIATAVLEICKTCDEKSRTALARTIATLDDFVSLEFKEDEDPLYMLYLKTNRKPTEELPDEWKDLLTAAWESDQPTPRRLVATTVVRTFPDRPKLAEELMELLADESLPPACRAAGLNGLRELPLEKIEAVADRLLSVAQQTGPAKKQLTAKTLDYQPARKPTDENDPYYSGRDVDVCIGHLLSFMDEHDEALLPWLEKLLERVQSEPATSPFFNGGSPPKVGYSEQIVSRAIQRAKGESLTDFNPAFFGGGVF